MLNGVKPNPNVLVTNLTDFELTTDELDVLNLGLKHGVLLRPKEAEMVSVIEDVYDQICRHKGFTENRFAKSRIQTALKSFTYNFLDLDDRQFKTDQRKIKIMKDIRKRCMILKPDKGQGIVLINKSDYYQSLERLFGDQTKFRISNDDPTLRNLSSVQNYLNTLLSRNEITEAEKKLMRPKSGHLGRANGLPKIHKVYDVLPPFRPIVDTTNTPHYGIGKFLSTLLNPLTLNDYTVKDSFEAAGRIRAIPEHLFQQGYRFVSFDVTSLFTNVPLERTVNVILKRVYEENLIETTLKKRTLKKLILDACKKTAFSFNNVIYEQVDGVSMGSSLGPVLANIIMTELETAIVDNLFNTGIIKFYVRYVDDTLVLAKPEDFDEILSQLNSFDENLRFTIDSFDDNNVHFLDLKIDETKTDLFFKPTHTGQYCHFTSQSPWRLKTAWVKALFHRANKICSSDAALKKQISRILSFMSWNGYPIAVARSMLKRLQFNKERNVDETTDSDVPKVYIKICYAGEHGEHLLKSCVKKLKRFTKKNIRFVTLFQTKKLSMFCPTKDKILNLQKSNVIYKLVCPGCGESYIGKTDRCLVTRLNEHGSRNDQPMFLHLINCHAFRDYVSLFGLPCGNDDSRFIIDVKEHIKNAVFDNYSIIDVNCSWSQLSFLEAYYIKHHNPAINKGLKASRELQLF